MDWYLYYITGASVLWISSVLLVIIGSVRLTGADRAHVVSYLTSSEKRRTGHTTARACFLEIMFSSTFGKRQVSASGMFLAACALFALSSLIAIYYRIFLFMDFNLSIFELISSHFILFLEYEKLSFIKLLIISVILIFVPINLSIIKARIIVRAICRYSNPIYTALLFTSDLIISLLIVISSIVAFVIIFMDMNMILLATIGYPIFGNIMGLVIGRWIAADGSPLDLIFSAPLLTSTWILITIIGSSITRAQLWERPYMNVMAKAARVAERPLVSMVAASICAAFVGLAFLFLINVMMPGELKTLADQSRAQPCTDECD